jgi:Ca-activated chloride channel family protein
MSFAWPAMLLCLVAVPLVVAGYVSMRRRRGRRMTALAAEGLVPTAASGRYRVRRHVPFACFVAALALLLFGMARPRMTIRVPHREGTVILAFDVSNSMLATDLAPTRMDAAKVAARRFVERQPAQVRVGVVAFSDGGLVVQEPTNVRPDVVSAIERLTPQGGTSLGQGIFTSLTAIAGEPIRVDPAQLTSLDTAEIGYFASSAIVLLSDGENRAMPDPLAVTELASVAGVRIYPIGVGSPGGTVIDIDGFTVATALDEAMLNEIAAMTQGEYFAAPDEDALNEVYDSIDLRFTTRAENTELTGILAGAGALLLVLGGALSLAWFGRLV